MATNVAQAREHTPAGSALHAYLGKASYQARTVTKESARKAEARTEAVAAIDGLVAASEDAMGPEMSELGYQPPTNQICMRQLHKRTKALTNKH